jgi:hypothetical protein
MCFCGDLFASELWSTDRYFVRMRGRRGLCLQICCVGMMGLSLWEDSLRAWFTVGPRLRSQRIAARFLGARFQNVESESSV